MSQVLNSWVAGGSIVMFSISKPRAQGVEGLVGVGGQALGSSENWVRSRL